MPINKYYFAPSEISFSKDKMTFDPSGNYRIFEIDKYYDSKNLTFQLETTIHL